MNIELLTDKNVDEYETFLLANPQTLLYASNKYRKFLEKLLDCESYYLLACNNYGSITGSLPIMLSRQDSHLGRIANSLPYYGSYGSIILSSNISENASYIRQSLLEHAYKTLNNLGVSAYTLITSPFDDMANYRQKCLEGCLIDHRLGQITTLPQQSEDPGATLLKMFEDPRPRNIRKAIKSGVKCRYSHSEGDMNFLYETHQDNIRSIGGIPKDKKFFDLVPEVFDESDFRIYTAEFQGRPVASLLVFYFNKTVEYFTPAIIDEFRSFQPLSLIIFEAMKDAVSLGYRYWNWGGTWLSQKGVFDFKRKWGAETREYLYFTKIFNSGIKNASKEALSKEYPNFYIIPFKELIV